MVKRKITETIKEYDDKGNIVKETITETMEDDDTPYVPYYPVYPTQPYNPVTCCSGGSGGVPQS